ncbi:MAG: MmcQ/YjbR family DNA-binding protein [Proteobacteria bacterium]|nr:MmcQ/YjbR family DNA-binding protein [Pseudomonadota bacterium]
MTPATFRKLALDLPEAKESEHVGHPDFRVRKKVFATLGYPDAAWGMVKLTPAQQRALVRAHPAVFRPVKGGWGLKGATNVKLRAATVAVLRPALEAAWNNSAPAALARTAP